MMIETTITKPTRDTTIGLMLHKHPLTGQMMIHAIRNGSLADKDPHLEPGMTLVSINGVSVRHMTLEQCVGLLRSSGGSIQVQAIPRPVPQTISAIKKEASTRLGIGLARDGSGAMVVTGVNDIGVFASSGLKKNMRILKVNGVVVDGMRKEEVAVLLKNAVDEVSLEVIDFLPDFYQPDLADTEVSEADIDLVPGEKTEEVGDEPFVVTATKEDASTRVGIAFAEDSTGVLIVSSLNVNSLFKGTNLKKNMKVLKINGESSQGMDKDKAAGMMKQATGEVSLEVVAYRPKLPAVGKGPEPSGPSSIVVRAVKKDPASRVGLGLATDKAGALVVKGISETGIFASSTELKKDMKILQINGMDVEGMSKEDAAAMLKNASSEVALTVVAYTPVLGGKSTASAPKSSAPSPVIVKGTKKDAGSRVGLGLATDGAGAIIVTGVSESGIFASSALMKGMKILQINNVDVTSKKKEEAASLLKNAAGEISLQVVDYTPLKSKGAAKK